MVHLILPEAPRSDRGRISVKLSITLVYGLPSYRVQIRAEIQATLFCLNYQVSLQQFFKSFRELLIRIPSALSHDREARAQVAVIVSVLLVTEID